MKKNYVMLAFATLMMAACANNDLVDDLVKEEVPQAIGFETFANKTTRAVDSGSATALDSYHKSFGVWAYKTTKTDGAVMPNYKVAYTAGSPATWEYKNVDGQSIKYWDKKADYSFYAYAPHSTNASEDSGVISISNGEYAANENLQSKIVDGDEKGFTTTPNSNAFKGTGVSSTTASTDWMMATKITGYNDYSSSVLEVFSHIMSKLVVNIKSTVAGTIVNSVKVNNVFGQGSYNGTAWVTAEGNKKSIEGVVGTIETANTSYYTMEYLLIPSTTAPTFTIEYEISGDTYKVENAAISNISGFSANTKYDLTVTIDLSEIQFTATASDFINHEANGGVTID